MVSKNRENLPEIIDRMMEKSSVFSFFQAIRLLLKEIGSQLIEDSHALNRTEILEKQIRIRPELSLRFPGTDITGVEKSKLDESRFLITATFLGLYGSSTPLPTFYTEDLIEERNEGKSIKRDFFDIINFEIYPLFYKIWCKHRPFYKICEESDETFTNLLYCLLGLENKALRSQFNHINRYFRYIGLSMQFPRSAEGLKSILEDYFNLKGQITINQFVLRQVTIPEDQHAFLGLSSCTLGEDCVIGRTINDMSGKFQIKICDTDAVALHSLLPDKSTFAELKQLIGFYVNQPLEWELALEIIDDDIETTQPGGDRWSNLGWNTWLVSENQGLHNAETVFN